ncbi:MAG TPA: hypothetical protein PKJ13_06200 [bacterium]|nr:hypothetical protein [bacterium]HPG84791.1 hypothetical protein [bacterium]HPM59019.1 hypothetical protein [bacterium]
MKNRCKIMGIAMILIMVIAISCFMLTGGDCNRSGDLFKEVEEERDDFQVVVR